MLRETPTDDPEIHYCGPPGFMAAEKVLDELVMPMSRRHSETFAPDLSFEDDIDHAQPRATAIA